VSRSDQYQITLHRVRDNADFGVWQTHSGGDWESDERGVGGNGLPITQLGTPPKLGPITCSRVFNPTKDMTRTLQVIQEEEEGLTEEFVDKGILGELEAAVGWDRFIASRQKLDYDGYAVGAPVARIAMLKSLKVVDVDVGSESPGADVYTIELNPDTPAQRH
jgi:hypothetical protein